MLRLSTATPGGPGQQALRKTRTESLSSANLSHIMSDYVS